MTDKYLLSETLLESSHSEFGACVKVGARISVDPVTREAANEDNLAVVDSVLLEMRGLIIMRHFGRVILHALFLIVVHTFCIDLILL